MSDSQRRLPAGGRLDRKQKVSFTFDGRPMWGLAGDTLASALLANGVETVARSFKYGRRRGIVGHGSEEPNAIVQLGSGAATVPNLKATQVELYEGLEARSVSGWPNLDVDVIALLGVFARFLPPGFYYKTFMAPARLWMTYEHFIRKAAGLGRAPQNPDPDRYDKINRHCDVLVIGGGPAGLAAAREATRQGSRVILVDEQSEMGGSLLSLGGSEADAAQLQWRDQTLAELEASVDVLLLPRSTAFGYYDHNFVGILERLEDHRGLTSPGRPRQRLHRVRARQIIMATGAQERPLVFANNDLPGVMLASSVRTYINRYAVIPGQRLALCTTNDNAYQLALDWQEAGCDIAVIADTRPEAEGVLPRLARERGIDVRTGTAIIEASGRKCVSGALLAPIHAGGKSLTGPATPVECDLIATSGGWSPVVHLSSHTGIRPIWDDEAIGFVPGPHADGPVAVGSAQGIYCPLACVEQARTEGAAAALRAGQGAGESSSPSPDIIAALEEPAQALFLVPHTKTTSRAPSQFVDFQLDVTAAAIELAAREGYESVEHVKRYTALGFGTDQGKLGNINGVAILADTLNQSIADTGTTMFRPAYTPVTFGAMAGGEVGDLFDPERYTAMHRWHSEQGAAWENVGQWKRPWYFPVAGESMEEAVQRECLAVRNSVGILDASTLGKIDIQGPDAAEFLTRVYTNSYLKLAPGKCRYGLMLHEDGMIFDDGVTACLGESHYLMHTTTGGAAGVLGWLELWRQTEWPELQVYFTSVTDHWATATLSGPNARKVLARVCHDVDLSDEAFAFMDWNSATVAGVPARIFRISFTGELSFEVNVPANFGRHVWERLMEAGKEFNITPYGTEAMHVLRAEKGFIIVGQDTDGSMTPDDMGMDWIVGKNKSFSFLGKRSLERSDTRRTNRKQLVGLRTVEPNEVLPEGAQIVNTPDQAVPMAMQGHVTSSYFSPSLGRSIALAVVKGGRNRLGEKVFCPLADGRNVAAVICQTVFYDPDGERQHV